MIEIIARDTCPTCGGLGEYVTQRMRAADPPLGWSGMDVIARCDECDPVTHTVSRVLATFADAAALLAVINESIGGSSGDMALLPTVVIGRAGSAVLAALGVSDDHL